MGKLKKSTIEFDSGRIERGMDSEANDNKQDSITVYY
jgi:hypothetical protein